MIEKFAEENNLIIGICKADKLAEASEGDRPFSPRGVSLEDNSFAKSVIVVGLGICKTIEGEFFKGVPRGRLSFVALGMDYHRLLTEKLQALAAVLSQYKEFQYKIHVDTGPLQEKNLAVAAGLGFKGRNSLVISPRFGSFFAIGLLLSDLELEVSRPQAARGCGNCTRCIDACPTGALGSHGLDWSRCISYLTQVKTLSAEQEIILLKKNPENYLYGCDCCQLVCPYNQGLSEKESMDAETAYPALGSLINMSRREIKERYGHTAAAWRLGCVKRNAELILTSKNCADPSLPNGTGR